jgi:hypothetical protein
MIDRETYETYSIPLEQQMKNIANMAKDMGAILHKASQICHDVKFIEDANRTIMDVSGKPGEGALEVIRDVDNDIIKINIFLEKYQKHKDKPGCSEVIKQVERLLTELNQLDDIVRLTPPDVMKEIKKSIKLVKSITATDEVKYDRSL